MKSGFVQIKDKTVPFDFRKTFWGMTRSDVKISEKNYPLSENETHITYNDTFMNLEATVGFHFVDDSLIEAGYAFREFYSDPNLYFSEYERIKSTLAQIYGEPLIQNDNCDCYEQNYCCLRSCKDADNKIYLVQWLTTRSIIRLLFVSDELSTEFGILHLSREQDTTANNFMS